MWSCQVLFVAVWLAWGGQCVAQTRAPSLTTIVERLSKHISIYETYEKDFLAMADTANTQSSPHHEQEFDNAFRFRFESDTAGHLVNSASQTYDYLTAMQDLVEVYMLLTSTHDRQVVRPVLLFRLNYYAK